MNTLLQNSPQMPWHTNLPRIFEAFGGLQRKYNWLVTDIECNWYPDDFPRATPKWLSGSELTRIVETYEIQFNWAVLSGFAEGIEIDLHAEDLPYADGNPMFWGDSPGIQHPLATVEIVCWDSSATLLMSKDPSLTQRFRAFFPGATDLDAFNRLRRQGSPP